MDFLKLVWMCFPLLIPRRPLSVLSRDLWMKCTVPQNITKQSHYLRNIYTLGPYWVRHNSWVFLKHIACTVSASVSLNINDAEFFPHTNGNTHFLHTPLSSPLVTSFSSLALGCWGFNMRKKTSYRLKILSLRFTANILYKNRQYGIYLYCTVDIMLTDHITSIIHNLRIPISNYEKW